MKKKLYLLIFISIFLLLPRQSYADCTNEELEHFKEIENEYKVTYDFNKDTKDYTIKIFNSEPEKYYFAPVEVDNDFLNKCTNLRKETVECKNVAADYYEFLVISTNEECDYGFKAVDEDLTITNQYWDDPLCEGNEEFVLCQPTYDKKISYDDFKSRIETYKNSKKNNKEEPQKNNEKNEIVKYISNNYQILLVIIAVFIALILLIILIAKNIKKSRRLE